MSDQPAVKPATSAQRSYIQALARRALMEPEQLVEMIRHMTGKKFMEMSSHEASRVIDELQAMRPGQYRKGMFA